MDNFKQQAAERAVEFIESGMVVGLGAGSTALFAVKRLAQLLHAGQLQNIVGVPCSVQTGDEATRLGIRLTTLDEQPVVNLTIDGADEVDPNFNLIKGGGGALLREKIVAQASQREIIVVDEGKLSEKLGTKWAVPIEVVEFGQRAQRLFLEALGARVTLRQKDGVTYHTDQGNIILDANFGPIADPAHLARQLDQRAGIVGHGLFIGLTTDLIVAGSGGIRHLKP